jgi:hypothetical protein
MKKTATLLLVLSVVVAVPSVAADRDGTWLINGIREYERVRDRAPNLSVAEAEDAATVAGYIRGVLDAQQEIALKAAFYGAEKRKPTKAAEAKKVVETSTYITPLYHTTFVVRPLNFDQYAQIIKNYLEKHPTEWDVDANQLIERALVDALDLHGAPMPDH